jgi:hypothetical protein
MTLSELNAQVALGEDSRRQFKQNMQSPDVLETEIVALANSGGGLVFWVWWKMAPYRDSAARMCRASTR